MTSFEKDVMRFVYSWRNTQGFSMTEKEFRKEFLNKWKEPEDFDETFHKVYKEALSETEGKVLALRINGSMYREIASEVGISVSHAMSIERTALIRLSEESNWEKLYKGLSVYEEWNHTVDAISPARPAGKVYLKELHFSPKTKRVLMFSGCKTLEEIMEVENMKSLKLHGKKLMAEVMMVIRNAGYDTKSIEYALNF